VANHAVHWTTDLDVLPKTVKALENASRERLSTDKSTLRLYHLRPVTEHQSATSEGVYVAWRRNGPNLSRKVIDAASSMLTREVQSKLTPVDADPDTQKSVRNMQTLVDGIKDANGITGLRQRVFQSGCTTTLGLAKVYADPQTKEIKIGKLNTNQSYWDDTESENGEEPLSFYYVDSLPKIVGKALWPKHADTIDQMDTFEIPPITGVDPPRGGVANNFKVIEAWSRKVGKPKGRHSIVLADGTALEDEKHDDEHLPIAAFRFSLPHRGWGGTSLGSIIAEKDLENKTLNESLVRSIRASVPIIWKPSETIWDNTITEDEFQVQEYTGQIPPKVEVPSVISKEILQRMADNEAAAMAEAGINVQLAEGNRPGPSLNSEPAIRAAVDTAQIRLVDIQNRWGEFDRDLTRAIIMVATRTYKDEDNEITAPGTKLIKKIKWKTDIGDLTEKKYTIQTKLASGLSLTWAGRLADIETIRKVAPSAMTEAQALRSLNLVDLETTTSRATAYQDRAESIISSALDDGVPITPPPYPELLRAVISTGRVDLMRAEDGEIDYPEDNIEALRKVVDKATTMLASLEPAAPPQPSAAPASANLANTPAAAPVTTPSPPGPGAAPIPAQA
jgi:hypothetical protein